MPDKMRKIISLQLLPRKKQMRIAMNKMRHLLTFYRLGPALLIFSLLVAGCADNPDEIRYDNKIRTFTLSDDAQDNTYTLGQYKQATARYILRPGHRPDGPPRVKQQATYQEVRGTQVAELQMVLDASDVLFDFDKWVIKKDAVPELDQWAIFFQENPPVSAAIYGYADSTGPTEYNLNLSEKRAQAVVNYLVGKGVSPSRLTAKGFGESNPVAPNTTSEGRQKNRRVELNL
jgi:outer membrane protein OmpA-like peptidoglycan-associated protein